MLMQLMATIEQYCDEEALRKICEAQIRFAKMVLYRQRVVLDMILVHTPSKLLLECKTSGSQEYADALGFYQEAVRKLQILIEKLQK